MKSHNPFLVIASLLTAAAALAHLGCIVFGEHWYRFFGAGEAMAQMAATGDSYPTVVTSVLVVVLSVWSLYAWSGAGMMRALPLLKLALPLISLVFIARAVGFIWLMPAFPENSLTFWLVSSAICLTIGVCYAVGTLRFFKSH